MKLHPAMPKKEVHFTHPNGAVQAGALSQPLELTTKLMELGVLPKTKEQRLADLEAAFAAMPKLNVDVYKYLDAHRERAAKMFGVAVEDVTPEQRRAAKADAFREAYSGKEVRK